LVTCSLERWLLIRFFGKDSLEEIKLSHVFIRALTINLILHINVLSYDQWFVFKTRCILDESFDFLLTIFISDRFVIRASFIKKCSFCSTHSLLGLECQLHNKILITWSNTLEQTLEYLIVLLYTVIIKTLEILF